MIPVIASSPSECGDQVLAILQSWSDFGLLQEFAWFVGGSDSSVKYLSDGVVQQVTAAELLSNSPMGIFSVGVEFVTSSNPVPEEAFKSLSSWNDETVRIVATKDQVRNVHLVIPDTPETDISHFCDNNRTVVWEPQDRAHDGLYGAPLDGSYAVRAAHAIAVVGELWAHGECSARAFELSKAKSDRSVVLARAFTRMLLLTHLENLLCEGLELGNDLPPKPTGGFDRVDLRSFIDGLAQEFVDEQPALQLSELADLSISAADPDLALTPREAIELISTFIRDIPTLLVDRGVEALRNAAWSRINRYAARLGIEIKQDLSESTDSFTDAQLSDSNDGFIEDLDVDKLWADFQLAVFSLLDGTPYPWTIGKLPPHDKQHLPITDSKRVVIGPSEEEGGDSLLSLVEKKFLELVEVATAEAEAAATEVSTYKAEIEVLTTGPSVEAKPTWRTRLRNIFRGKPKPYQHLQGLQSEAKSRVQRIAGLSFTFGSIVSTALALVLSPLTGIISAITFIVGAIVGVIRELWIANLQRRRLEITLGWKMYQMMARNEKSRRRRMDNLRIERRVDELRTWTEIIRTVVNNPFNIAPPKEVDVLQLQIPRPLAFVASIGVVNEVAARNAAERFRKQQFRAGWLQQRFAALENAFMGIQGSQRTEFDGNPLTPENDTSRDREALRWKLLDYFETQIGDAARDRTFQDELQKFLEEDNTNLLIEEIQQLEVFGDNAHKPVIDLHTPQTPDAYFAEAANMSTFPEILFEHQEDRLTAAAPNQDQKTRVSTAPRVTMPRAKSKLRSPFQFVSVSQYSIPFKAERLVMVQKLDESDTTSPINRSDEIPDVSGGS